MVDLNSKEYVVIVQCDIVQERCPGYLCEKAFTERTGGFVIYAKDKDYRKINLACGGCCGRALHRKLTHLKRSLKKKENIDKDKIVIQFSSCITKDNYHAPPCPHLDYIKALIALVSDYDCWKEHDPNVKKQDLLQEIIANLQAATQNAVELIKAVLQTGEPLCADDCPCRKSLELAVWTNPEKLDPAKRKSLDVLFE